MFRFLLAALFMLSFAQTAKADSISIRADIWCPYNCDPADKKIGYGMEIVKTVFEKAGHTIDYQILPWEKSIERTRAGDFVSIIGAAKNDAPDFIYPAETIGLSSTSFASLKEKNYDIKSVGDLSGKLLGAIEAYSYNPSLDDYIAKNKDDRQKISFAKGDDALEINIKKLVDGKLDVVAEDTNVLFYKTNKMGFSSQLTIKKDAEKLSEIYLAFSPKNPKAKEYAAVLDKGIADMRASGELKTILRKYGLSDWK